MERYRGLIDILIVYDTEEFAKAEATKFNDYLKLFRHFYNENEGIDMENELPIEDSLEMPMDSALLDGVEVEN